MSLQKTIEIVKIVFLIALIGVATFCGQNSSVKKKFITTSSKEVPRKDNNGTQQPISEEENKNEDESDERLSNDERDLHELFVTALFIQNTKTDFTDLYHQFDFKEIHFEIITPPPQV